MKPANEYPVTFGYLATGTVNGKPYTHRGQDRKTPVGTPIRIDSDVIGFTGNTGLSTGPHLHTQAGTDPGVQQTVNPSPHEFKPGTVTATGTGNQWGKYVTIKVGNHYITYAHLDEINAVVGQKVGSQVAVVEDEYIADLLWKIGYMQTPSAKEKQNLVGNPIKDVLEYIWNSKRFNDNKFKVLVSEPRLRKENAELKEQLGSDGTELKPGRYIVK
jgi:hypothetical protein